MAPPPEPHVLENPNIKSLDSAEILQSTQEVKQLKLALEIVHDEMASMREDLKMQAGLIDGLDRQYKKLFMEHITLKHESNE